MSEVAADDQVVGPVCAANGLLSCAPRHSLDRQTFWMSGFRINRSGLLTRAEVARYTAG